MDRHDLSALGNILARADGVHRMDYLHDLLPLVNVPPKRVFLRHDVDGNNTSLESALAMAQWEKRHGYQSTYYFLPGTPYWKPANAWVFKQIAALGHEVGYHNNSLATAVVKHWKIDPFVHLEVTLAELREWSGEPVLGTASHGDPACTYGGFINYQLFVEGNVGGHVQNNYKSPAELGFEPRPLADFGFTHQGDWLPRPHYVTDSGGNWINYKDHDYVHTLLEAEALFPWDDGHLVILQHPDWWPVALYD